MGARDRVRRMAGATARVIRPDTEEAAGLDAADDAYWDAVPPEQRMMLAFRLSLHQWSLRGWREDEAAARLRRSVARVRRPPGTR
jgi:hypothetical protein